MKTSHSPKTLIDRMLDGDRTSFNDIVAWYAGDVLRLCIMLLRRREDAEDVLQESMLRLVKQVKAGRFRKQNGSIKGFLLQTARNLCIDKLRKKSGFLTSTDDYIIEKISVHESDTPAQATDAKRLEDEFQKALGQLNDSQRTVFVLHELNGEPYKQIAQSLDISVEAVRKHMFRARKILIQQLASFAGEV